MITFLIIISLIVMLRWIRFEFNECIKEADNPVYINEMKNRKNLFLAIAVLFGMALIIKVNVLL